MPPARGNLQDLLRSADTQGLFQEHKRPKEPGGAPRRAVFHQIPLSGPRWEEREYGRLSTGVTGPGPAGCVSPADQNPRTSEFHARSPVPTKIGSFPSEGG